MTNDKELTTKSFNEYLQMVTDSPVGIRRKIVVLHKYLNKIINKKKYVYVTHDPLYEKVVCVHDKPNTLCSNCVELNKERLEGAGPVGAYYLQESKHLIQTT